MRIELHFYGTANAKPIEITATPHEWGENPRIPRVGEYVSLEEDGEVDLPEGEVRSVTYFRDHIRVVLRK